MKHRQEKEGRSLAIDTAGHEAIEGSLENGPQMVRCHLGRFQDEMRKLTPNFKLLLPYEAARLSSTHNQLINNRHVY